jgi:Cys-tRNA(Pro)/Cys-tRNA(Cys) deacylase
MSSTQYVPSVSSASVRCGFASVESTGGQASGVAKQARRGTPALVELQRAGVEHRIHEFDHDPAERNFGLAAAAALGADPARVFKTLVARADDRHVVAIVPVDRQLSLKSLAAAVGAKRAELSEPDDAQRVTGYVVGGISPFGQRKRLLTVLDVSALDHDTIYVSGGRRGLDVELSPSDLVSVLAAEAQDIAV